MGMKHGKGISRPALLLALAWVLLDGGAALAVTSRVLCRQSCDSLIRHGCGIGGHGRCRRNVLRQCRAEGPARCSEAQACDDSCTAIVAECGASFGAGPGRAFLCEGFAFDHCRRLGLGYCTAAPETVNGCNRFAAEDHRGEPAVTVTFEFDGVAYDYSPECILVSPGTAVRFVGEFGKEPLVGGTPPNADPASPFSPTVGEGTSREFVLTTPGGFPYFGGDFGTFSTTGLFGLPWGAVLVDDERP